MSRQNPTNGLVGDCGLEGFKGNVWVEVSYTSVGSSVLKDSFCPSMTVNRLPTLLLCLELEVNWARKMPIMWSHDNFDASDKALYQLVATP